MVLIFCFLVVGSRGVPRPGAAKKRKRVKTKSFHYLLWGPAGPRGVPRGPAPKKQKFAQKAQDSPKNKNSPKKQKSPKFMAIHVMEFMNAGFQSPVFLVCVGFPSLFLAFWVFCGLYFRSAFLFFLFFGFRRIKLLATFAESKHRKWGTVIILGHSSNACHAHALNYL